MKMRSLVLVALFAFATGVASADPPTAPTSEKAVMLYFAKSFGSTQRQNRTPLAFGLKFQAASPFTAARPVALLDARYALGGKKTFALAGLNAFDSGSSDDSSKESTGSSAELWRQHPGWTAAMVALAVLGAMCATEELICKGGGHGYRAPSETPTPPGGG